MERPDSAELRQEDLDTGYYRDRDSDADTGERHEVIPWSMDRESVLLQIVRVSGDLSNMAEKMMHYAENAHKAAIRELSEFNVGKKE